MSLFSSWRPDQQGASGHAAGELIPEHSFSCCFYRDPWDSLPTNQVLEAISRTSLHV
jgi:hypothetical protein